MIGNNNKIFFFITYEKKYDSYIEITSKTLGFTNYKREFTEIVKKNDKEYIISINSFDLNVNDIKKTIEDDKYKLILNINYNFFFGSTYKGEIFFEEKRTTFIYDFKINESTSFLNLKLSFKEKLMLFKKYLNTKKSEQGDPLSNALIEDSIEFISDNEKTKRYNFEDYLELLLFSYKTNKFKTLLQKFNVKKCDLTNDFKPENYSAILEELALNPEIYTKYCFKTEEENECKKQIYTILLCFKIKYGKDSVKSLINQKELKKLYAEIINENEKLYCIVDKADEELIELIMNQKKLSFGIIKKIIFVFTPEKVIAFINRNYNIIDNEINKNSLDYKHEDLRLSVDFANSNIKGKSKSPIYDKIENLHLKKRKYNFILFSERLYKEYFNNDEVKLFIINKSIYICLKNDKKYEIFKNNELRKLVKANNIQILDYLEKDFSFYEKSEYEIYYYDYYDKKYTKYCKYNKENITTYKPLNIFKRFEIKTMDEVFFKKWKY